MSDGLFAGLKVIDCASFVAAPAAATVFSDFGADVIKIEPPVGGGDGYRTLYSRPGAPVCDTDYGWMHGSRNKRGLALDLKSEDGLDILHRLIDNADVFVTNLPFPVRRRMKIAHDDLSNRNPRLIYASFTAYGEKGEEADKTGFDATAYWARSGLMDQVRADATVLPARSVTAMGDHPSAMTLYAAIVTALYRRQITGRGGLVASSLLANGLWANSFLVQARLLGASPPPRPKRANSLTAMVNIYRTRDERWFNLAMVNDIKQFPVLMAALGRPGIAEDPRFASREARTANAPVLLTMLDELFAKLTLAEACRLLDQAGITHGVVGIMDDIVDDRQMRDAEAIVPMADGKAETVSSPFTIDSETKTPPGAAPSLGQHSDEILREYGYGEAEIARLRESKVIA